MVRDVSDDSRKYVYGEIDVYREKSCINGGIYLYILLHYLILGSYGSISCKEVAIFHSFH